MSAMIFGQRASGNWFSAVPRKKRSARWSGASQSPGALPADRRVRDPLARFLLSQYLAQLSQEARPRAGVGGQSFQGSFEFAPVSRQLECGQPRQWMFRRRDVRWVGRHRFTVLPGNKLSWKGPVVPAYNAPDGQSR